MLGVPSATLSEVVPIDDHVSWLSSEEFYHVQLCHISGLILARNRGNSIHSLSTTYGIDEKLELLANHMPQAASLVGHPDQLHRWPQPKISF
jgi:hypothetical protein